MSTVGEISDGYHTFNELYEYRMLYNAHAAQGWLESGIPVVKSWRHSDGELCFGGGWFVVTATLPTGQVSNHYQEDNWDLFAVPEVGCAPVWDGHTPAEAANRLRADLLEGDNVSTLEDFKNAPIGATATLGDGSRAIKMGDLRRRWMTPNGFYLSDVQMRDRGFTLDPLPEPLQPTEKETK